MTFQGSCLFQRGVRRNPSLGGDLGLWSLPDTCSRSTALPLTVTDRVSQSQALYSAVARVRSKKATSMCSHFPHILRNTVFLSYIFIHRKSQQSVITVSSVFICVIILDTLCLSRSSLHFSPFCSASCSAVLQKPCQWDSHDLWFPIGFGQWEPWQEIRGWDEREIRVCIPLAPSLRGSFGWTCPFSWVSVPF